MLSPPSGSLMYGARLGPPHAACPPRVLPLCHLHSPSKLFDCALLCYTLALATALIHSYGSVFMSSPVCRHGSPHHRSLLELAPPFTLLYAFYSSYLYVYLLAENNVCSPAIASRRCFSLRSHSHCRQQRTRRSSGRPRGYPGQCPSREVPISRAGHRPFFEVRTLQVLV